MDLSTISLLYLATIGICLSSFPVQAASASDETTANCKYVRDKCSGFDQVKTLESFVEFYQRYNLLNEHLHSKKLSSKCKEAEEICVQNGLHYSVVHSLGQQVMKFKREGEVVCTIMYSLNLYNLHRQLTNIEREPRLLHVLRSLANRWSLRCRSSVKNRLLEVEQRAPDAIKHSAFVVNLLYLGISKVALLPLEPEHYVPVLEGEETVDERVSSIGRGPSGFEFKLTQQVRVALDGARMSCRTLRPYQVNILGSLGLMASIGYGVAPDFRGRSLNEESSETRSLVRKWILSAILCQSLGGLLKQAAVSTDNKQVLRLKVMPLERPEVPRLPEDEIGFDELNLSETNSMPKDADLSKLDSFVFVPSQQALQRKLQLITGPSYQMASAIYAYLDLTQLNDRYKIPFAILGLEVPNEDPFKNVRENDDDDEDEEEQNDEEEE